MCAKAINVSHGLSDFKGNLLTALQRRVDSIKQRRESCAGVQQPVGLAGRDASTHKDAALRVVRAIAGMDAHAGKPGHVLEQRQLLLEPVAVGDDDLVRAARDRGLAGDFFVTFFKVTVDVLQRVALEDIVDVHRPNGAVVREVAALEFEFHL